MSDRLKIAMRKRTVKMRPERGAAPVTKRHYRPPSDGQLYNWISVILYGFIIKDSPVLNAILGNEVLRDKWKKKHREHQEMIWRMESGQ